MLLQGSGFGAYKLKWNYWEMIVDWMVHVLSSKMNVAIAKLISVYVLKIASLLANPVFKTRAWRLDMIANPIHKEWKDNHKIKVIY